MTTPDTLPAPGTESFTNSETPGSQAPAPREDTTARKGGRPKDPQAKTVQQIALRPADWEYAALWAIDSYNVADNASTRMERMISRLRSMAPKGPDAFGFERDPTKPLKPRRTAAIAREARRRGIETAELENEMWALYKEERDKAQKESGK